MSSAALVFHGKFASRWNRTPTNRAFTNHKHHDQKQPLNCHFHRRFPALVWHRETWAGCAKKNPHVQKQQQSSSLAQEVKSQMFPPTLPPYCQLAGHGCHLWYPFPPPLSVPAAVQSLPVWLHHELSMIPDIPASLSETSPCLSQLDLGTAAQKSISSLVQVGIKPRERVIST